MLRCANCQSAAIMPKSGLCLACGFIAGVEKYQKDEQSLATDVSELDNTEDSNTDTKASEQENISDVLDEESLTLSETEATSLIEEHEQEHLTAAPELDNTADSNTDTKASEQESISNTLDNEKTVLSISAVNHQAKVNKFDWDKSIPPFLQVTHKAKLKKSHTRIIESCQKDLEPLKGALVSKGEGVARSFMVSSTYRKEGVTTSALAVSIALSRFGHSKVLLIDANAVAPSLHDAFSLTHCPGFIDYISGTGFSVNKKSTVHSIYQEMDEITRENNVCLWAKYAYYTEYQGFYVMPYALKINSSSLWDVVESANFTNKLEQLKQAFDYIVFDAPAILGSSEPALLSQYIEGVILVIEAEKTKWEVTELAVNNVTNSGGTFVGAILNKRKFYIPKLLYRWI